MKKISLFVFISLISSSVWCDSNSVKNSNPGHCLKWKKICKMERHCVYRSAERTGCFRCVKPNHYGFHLHPQIDRNTCDLSTVQYLQTMGYRCYQPHGAQKCTNFSAPIKKCNLECVS